MHPLRGCAVGLRKGRDIIAAVDDSPESRAESQPQPKPGNPWRYIVMWTAFGVTLVVTVIVVVQAILKTTGFD